MTAKALRALLPVLVELREAGIARMSLGEGKERLSFEFARPEPPSVNPAIEPGTDATAEQDEAELDPRYFLEKFTREGGHERGRDT